MSSTPFTSLGSLRLNNLAAATSPTISSPSSSSVQKYCPTRSLTGVCVSLFSVSHLLHCRYASTCQTVGMNLGYFTSFTVFLALNDPDFCNKYLRHPHSASKQVT